MYLRPRLQERRNAQTPPPSPLPPPHAAPDPVPPVVVVSLVCSVGRVAVETISATLSGDDVTGAVVCTMGHPGLVPGSSEGMADTNVRVRGSRVPPAWKLLVVRRPGAEDTRNTGAWRVW